MQLPFMHLPLTHLHVPVKCKDTCTAIYVDFLLVEHVGPVHPELHLHMFGPVHVPCTQLGLQVTVRVYRKNYGDTLLTYDVH